MFVQRNQAGAIAGLFAQRQPGFAEEELNEDHADVIIFRGKQAVASKPAASRAEKMLTGAFKALIDKGIVTKADLPKDLADLL